MNKKPFPYPDTMYVLATDESGEPLHDGTVNEVIYQASEQAEVYAAVDEVKYVAVYRLVEVCAVTVAVDIVPVPS